MIQLTPKIISRELIPVSPWVQLTKKVVEFLPHQAPEIYHSVAIPDYTAMIAETPSGLVPIVRQYRPAIEAYTWELPAGLVETGENPEETCRRELKEETGLEANTIIHLGSYCVDTGRLENKLHAFYVQTNDPPPHFVPEPGTVVEYILNLKTLRERIILKGEFHLMSHIAVIWLYEQLKKS